MSDYLVVASTAKSQDHQALGAMNMALELCHQGYGVSVVLLDDEDTPCVRPEIIKRLSALMLSGAHVFTRWNFHPNAGDQSTDPRRVSEAVIEAHRAAGDIVIWPAG
jgi:hypothetical protein